MESSVWDLVKTKGTIYAKYMRDKLDKTPDNVRSKSKKTFSGCFLTLAAVFFVIALLSYLIHLYDTETITTIERVKTYGNINMIEYKCVSSGGCTVSFSQYKRDGVCGSLYNKSDIHMDNGDTQLLVVCKGSNTEGTVVRSTFNEVEMHRDLRRLWILELVTGGENEPIEEIVQNKMRVVHMQNTAVVDKESQITSSSWDLQPTSTIFVDTVCADNMTPIGYICGSIVLTQAKLNIQEITFRKNNIQTGITTPVSATISILNLVFSIVAVLFKEKVN